MRINFILYFFEIKLHVKQNAILNKNMEKLIKNVLSGPSRLIKEIDDKYLYLNFLHHKTFIVLYLSTVMSINFIFYFFK